MSRNDPFYDGLIECLPNLRAFARLLARDPTRAEDLVQDTIVRAISHREQFQTGTNLRAWLITILRNWYFNDARRTMQRAARAFELRSFDQSESGGQEERMQLRDVKREFDKLPAAQREALLLVGVNGFSYEEAGQIAGCAVGTMKSRVSRARLQLQTSLGDSSPDAVISAPSLDTAVSARDIGINMAGSGKLGRAADKRLGVLNADNGAHL